MKKIVLLGASSLLGHWFKPELEKDNFFKVITVGRSSDNDFACELTDEKQFAAIMSDVSPDIIINLAAEADVDLCERDMNRAFLANVQIPKNVAWYASANKLDKIIHISTDHVYDGDGMKNESQINIKNIYALTKLSGELCLPRNSFILRTNFFGKSCAKKSSFSDWVAGAFKSGDKFNLFNDSYFSPVHWTTLFSVVEKCIQSDAYGTYNVGASTYLSKADFAIQVAKTLGLHHENYNLIKTTDVVGRARRPLNMAMSSQKLKKSMDVSIGSLENEINKLKKEYV